MSESDVGDSTQAVRQPAGAELTRLAAAQAAALFLGAGRPKNVVGYGYGVKWVNGQPTGRAALLVFVTRKVPESLLADADLVPPQLEDGTATDVVAVGNLVAQSGAAVLPVDEVTAAQPGPATAGPPPGAAVAVFAPQLGAAGLTRRMRPCPAGFSIGNVAATAGTLAGVVYDFLPGASVNPPAAGIGVPSACYVLSNNHVLAASNAAALGSSVLQPGRGDGGADPDDRIGVLSRFVPLDFTPQIPLDQQNNVVDCAIAACQFQDATREIYFNAAPRGWRRRADVGVGDLVRKTGRTTSTTVGRVIAVEATVDINYAVGVARFTDQILITCMSAGGDSGSLVTSLDDVAVGLLFAGSGQMTVANYFETVRTMLRVEIAELIL